MTTASRHWSTGPRMQRLTSSWPAASSARAKRRWGGEGGELQQCVHHSGPMSPQDARRTLLEGLSFWLHSNSAEEGSAAQPASTPAPSSPGPSYLSRLSCSRLLLELGEYEVRHDPSTLAHLVSVPRPLQPARAVLEALLKEDDEVVEAWYLMGWLSHLTHDHASTRFYLEQTEKVGHASHKLNLIWHQSTD